MGRFESSAESVSISLVGSGIRPPPVPEPLEEGSFLPAHAVEAVTAALPLEARIWFVEREARPLGPFRVEQLRALWQRHRLDADPLLWCAAWSQWRRLSRVPELVAAMTRSGGPEVPVDMRLFKPQAVARRSAAPPKPPAPVLRVAEVEAWPRMLQEEKARLLSRGVNPDTRASSTLARATVLAVRVGGEAPAPARSPSSRETLLLLCAILGPLLLGYVASTFILYYQAQRSASALHAEPPRSPEDPPLNPVPRDAKHPGA